MSGSDRSKRTALVEWIFPLIGLLIALFIAWGIGFLQSNEANKRRQTAQSYQEEAKKRAERECISTQPASVFQCVVEKYEASDDRQRAEQDLTAQQQAAWAGMTSSIWSFVGLFATLLGLIWIRASLIATREALGEARAANRISNEQFKSGFRPWLIPKIAGPCVPHDVHLAGGKAGPFRSKQGRPAVPIEANVWIENFGEMPATIIGIWAGVEFPLINKWPADDFYHVLSKGESLFIVGQQSNLVTGQAEVTGGLVDLVEFYPEIEAEVRQSPPPVICQALYMDPMGNKRLMQCAFISRTMRGGWQRYGGARYNWDREVNDSQQTGQN